MMFRIKTKLLRTLFLNDKIALFVILIFFFTSSFGKDDVMPFIGLDLFCQDFGLTIYDLSDLLRGSFESTSCG